MNRKYLLEKSKPKAKISNTNKYRNNKQIKESNTASKRNIQASKNF